MLTDAVEGVGFSLNCGEGGLTDEEGREVFEVDNGLVPGGFPAEECPAGEGSEGEEEDVLAPSGDVLEGSERIEA